MTTRESLIETLQLTLNILKEPPDTSDPHALITIDILAITKLRDMFNKNIAFLQRQLEELSVSPD
jgi:hypothetical protein